MATCRQSIIWKHHRFIILIFPQFQLTLVQPENVVMTQTYWGMKVSSTLVWSWHHLSLARKAMTSSVSLQYECFYKDFAVFMALHHCWSSADAEIKTKTRPASADPHAASPWLRLLRRPEYKWLRTQFAASHGERVGGRKICRPAHWRECDENEICAGFFFFCIPLFVGAVTFNAKLELWQFIGLPIRPTVKNWCANLNQLHIHPKIFGSIKNTNI